jgi:cardiolipin synthase
MFWTPIEQFTAWLGTLLHVALAAWVTGHALLKKRDVSATIAWIGLAWLSPFVGPLLYIGFGINRVERRAMKTRGRRAGSWIDDPLTFADPRDDHFAPLEHAIGMLTRRPPRGGNKLTLLRNGDEAYPPMLAAIAEAKESVALLSYIFDDDNVGRRFIDALAAAKDRGVEVRVLVDGIGSGYFISPAYAALVARGVRVERFMHTWVPWRMPFVNLRNHKKILVVDGRHAFTGGINIRQSNLLASEPRDPVRDMHFHVEGPVVRQITEAFATDWFFAANEELTGEKWFPSLAPAGSASARVVTSGPDHELERVGLTMLAAIGVARDSIQILTPYFLPDDRFLSALILAAMRGVAVDIVLPEKGDHPPVDWAVNAHIPPLLRAGARIWRAPLPFEHSKLMAVDRAWSLIGSANWDMRSIRLNFELNVSVCCPEFGAVIAGAIERRQGAPVTLDQLRDRPLLTRLRDGAARLMLPYL